MVILYLVLKIANSSFTFIIILHAIYVRILSIWRYSTNEYQNRVHIGNDVLKTHVKFKFLHRYKP